MVLCESERSGFMKGVFMSVNDLPWVDSECGYRPEMEFERQIDVPGMVLGNGRKLQIANQASRGTFPGNRILDA